MSRKQRPPGKAKPSPPSQPPRKPLWIVASLAVLVAVAFAFTKTRHQNHAEEKEKPVHITGPVTFSKDIAPIVFENCAQCHHAGASGPFELLTYADVKKRAKDIARVTAARIMPPWQPEHGYGEFEGERRLTPLQLGLIQKWVEQDAPEGNAAETPPAPEFKNQWQLGAPDLIVQPTAAYNLPAEGKDVYFNFVTPIEIPANRYVAALDVLPGNRTVHHAFINTDETRGSRRLGAKSNPPGFPGMEVPETASMPRGQLLGWQPGKIAAKNPPGLSWMLRTNTDLVLQVHMNPSGKTETVQPQVGFYFTDQAPTNTCYRIRLNSLLLDIPAGMSNYVSELNYTLPVDVDLIRVGAHAHYLARDMQGYATLPNGEKKWLLWIKDWNFQWQGDYKYKTPVHIPKGSKLTMRFTYDNSANNPRNPFNPPRRTLWGLQTTDEMGELYFQVLTANPDDLKTLGNDYTREIYRTSFDFYQYRVKIDPTDAHFQQRLGRALIGMGKNDEAAAHLLEAIRLQPTNDLAHFDLGSLYLRTGRARDAYQEFQITTRYNPDDSEAFGSLGIICLQAGRLDEARDHFQAALRINPEDALAARYLARLNAQ